MKTLIIISALLISLFTYGQKNSTDAVKGKTSVDSIYIPIDLNDCFKQLDKMFPDSIKATIKILREEEFSSGYHLGLGMWLRNNWGLWKGSRLSRYFNSIGIYHPDDMTGVILDSYHRKMLGNEIKLEDQVKFYQDYWEKSKQEDLERRTKDFNTYKIGDSISFKYHYGFTTKTQEKKFDDNTCTAKGIIIKKDNVNLFIKVRLIKTCDTNGIVYKDNEESVFYDTKTGKTTKPKKRIVVYMKKGQENWFNYSDWDSPD